MADQDPKPQYTSPEGRLINHSFFQRDVYDEGGPNEGKPSYKFEMAFDPATLDESALVDGIIEGAMDHWGLSEEEVTEAMWDLDPNDEDAIMWCLDGDKLKRKRERKGKDGDAYEGMSVIRGHTIYNKNGDPGEGGISVYLEDVSEAAATDQGKIYRGSMGKVGVTLNFYEESRTGQRCVSYYLQAYQKTGDGEKLSSGGDKSGLFEPVGRKKGGRKKRGK